MLNELQQEAQKLKINLDVEGQDQLDRYLTYLASLLKGRDIKDLQEVKEITTLKKIKRIITSIYLILNNQPVTENEYELQTEDLLIVDLNQSLEKDEEVRSFQANNNLDKIAWVKCFWNQERHIFDLVIFINNNQIPIKTKSLIAPVFNDLGELAAIQETEQGETVNFKGQTWQKKYDKINQIEFAGDDYILAIVSHGSISFIADGKQRVSVTGDLNTYSKLTANKDFYACVYQKKIGDWPNQQTRYRIMNEKLGISGGIKSSKEVFKTVTGLKMFPNDSRYVATVEFDSGYGLSIMDKYLKENFKNAHSPVVSPDGQQVACVCEPLKDIWTVFIYNVQTKKKKFWNYNFKLDDDKISRPQIPVFSHNGELIAARLRNRETKYKNNLFKDDVTKYQLVINGKVDKTEYYNIHKIIFTEDDKKVVMLVEKEPGVFYRVVREVDDILTDRK